MTEERNELYESEEEEAEFVRSEEYLDTYRADHKEEEAENPRVDTSCARNSSEEEIRGTGRLPTLQPAPQFAPLHYPVP